MEIWDKRDNAFTKILVQALQLHFIALSIFSWPTTYTRDVRQHGMAWHGIFCDALYHDRACCGNMHVAYQSLDSAACLLYLIVSFYLAHNDPFILIYPLISINQFMWMNDEGFGCDVWDPFCTMFFCRKPSHFLW